MAIEHRIKSTDSLRTLAQQYLGDNLRWQEIADFNSLTSPYIVEDDTTRRNLTHGNGYARVTRTNSRTARILPKGWQLYTAHDAFSGQRKYFEVMEDVLFPEGERTTFVPIRATVPGVLGNLGPNTYLVPGLGFDENGFEVDEIVTLEQFSGGKDIRILIIGDYIYIPDNTESITYTDWGRMTAFVGEEDLILDATGELQVDGFGDVSSAKGLDNIAQAINHRLMTERGSLKLHPTYGSEIHLLIGKWQSPHHMKMIELDIYETLAYEDRIREVKVTEIQLEGTSVHVYLTFKMQEVERILEREFILNYVGITN